MIKNGYSKNLIQNQKKKRIKLKDVSLRSQRRSTKKIPVETGNVFLRISL